eukprot:TRINITY_DN88401_c0_g1_i1.p1 TRINITY_DN88401_c0_g1~~TRINITY_DN88401_c0_g1_i1.p1  ORF type:complete len:401 (-),score=56.64 TRINITY_DN88401_c0_g1_i1:189-1391(-)
MTSADAAPLRGICVIDLTRIVAGPHCTKILQDLGARVIKIELKSDGGDILRFFEPRTGSGDLTSDSAYFAQLNQGKESILLDLSLDQERRPTNFADREIFENMLRRADVLCENFRPGRMDRLGYGWQAVHQEYPHLVYCAISGFGASGPYREFGGVDTIIQAMSGFVSTTGFEEKSVKVGTTVSDLLAGTYAAVGIQSALLGRARDGEGRFVDISMLDASFAFHAREFASYSVTGTETPRMGNATLVSPCMGVFMCADGQQIAFAGKFSASWLAETLEAPEIETDERFQSYDLMMTNHKPLGEAIAAAFTRRSRAEWIERCRLAGAPAGPVNSMADLAEDPQLAFRNMICQSSDGRFTLIGNPVKVSGLRDTPTLTGPPAADEHGAALRREFQRGPDSKL